MTKCTRPVRRLTESTCYSRGGHRQVVVEIPCGGRTIGFRLAKSRKTYYLATSDCLTMAIRVELAAVKQARKEARKAKSGK